MAVRIKSLAVSGPVWVALTTGTAVRLSPGETTDELPDVAVADNAAVDKLVRRGLIEVQTAAQPARTRKRPAAPSGPADSRR